MITLAPRDLRLARRGPRAPLASWAAVGPSCAGPAFTAPPRR